MPFNAQELIEQAKKHGRHAAAEGLITLGFSILFFWPAYRYVPEVHDFVKNFPHVWPSIWENVRQSLKS